MHHHVKAPARPGPSLFFPSPVSLPPTTTTAVALENVSRLVDELVDILIVRRKLCYLSNKLGNLSGKPSSNTFRSIYRSL